MKKIGVVLGLLALSFCYLGSAQAQDKYTWTVKNTDNKPYKIKYTCEMANGNWRASKKGEMLRPNQTLTLKGNNYTFQYMPHTANYFSNQAYNTITHGKETENWVIKYGEMVSSQADDTNKHHLETKNPLLTVNYEKEEIRQWINDNVNKKPYRTGIQMVSKKLGKKPYQSDEVRTFWIYKKKEYGDYCIQVKIDGSVDPRTKKRLAGYASTSRFQGAACNK